MSDHTFLLENSHELKTVQFEAWQYDNELQLNIVSIENKTVPACTLQSLITHSKTEATPGDDDPDRDMEVMY